MPNTYSQIYIQIVFAVRGRENFISEKFKDALEKYICGIVNNNKSKPLAIYCNPDHVHILIGLHPSVSISEMAKLIKTNSSKWINEQDFIEGKFEWQSGYGAFSYNRSLLDVVVKYILNQKTHHQKQSFKNEYLEFLKRFEIEYNPKYLFDFLE